MQRHAKGKSLHKGMALDIRLAKIYTLQQKKLEKSMLYIFDMGGVCCNTWLGTDRVCETIGISKDEFEKTYGKGTENDLFQKCTKGEITTEGFWKEFSARCGIKVQTDWFHFLFHPVLIRETVDIIDTLKANGHRVVCGTNTISGHYMNHMENGDYAIFDQTYASCMMGVAKPDPAFYSFILKCESTEPEKTVFIDDREENVKSASRLGIRGIHFHGNYDEILKSQI